MRCSTVRITSSPCLTCRPARTRLSRESSSAQVKEPDDCASLCMLAVLFFTSCLMICYFLSHNWMCLFLSGRHDEALAIAERGRTRAFADLLVERQKGSQQAASADLYIPVTTEHILETVNSQRAMVLYYSLAGGFLYSWLICPGSGYLCSNSPVLCALLEIPFSFKNAL